MSLHLHYTGLLLNVEDDGHPTYWLYTFHGGKKFYCSSKQLPLGNVVKVRFVNRYEDDFPIITHLWNYGEPV